MNCDECRLHSSAFLDNELSASMRDEVRHHLTDCDACESEFAELAALHQRLGLLQMQFNSRDVSRQILSREGDNLPVDNVRLKHSGFYPRMLTAVLTFAVAVSCAAVLLRVVFVHSDEAVTTPPLNVAKLVRSTGPVEVQRKDTVSWHTLSANDIGLSSGDRIRTPASVLCEIVTEDKMTLRLNQQSELRVLDRNRIECVEGTIWCKTAKTASEIQVPVGRSHEEPSPDSWANGLQAPIFRCPEAIEVQWRINKDETACTTIGDEKAVLQSQALSCVIEPGQNMSFSNDTIQASNGDPAFNRISSKIWQLPLLSQGDRLDPEFIDLIETALSFIGFSKAVVSYENDIRALGPPGAIPLLAYVSDTRSKRGEAHLRMRAMELACDMADQSSLPRLAKLAEDTDPMIAALASSTIERLDIKSR